MNTDPRRPVQNKTAQKPAAKAPQKAAVKPFISFGIAKVGIIS